mmetsp:Transcript_74772/g.118973  ORF Transcript_74772/g.118973 Transcript_74772/m.118973 type:complete len:161 (+) Transcript_74772:79-561(+)
MFSRQIVRNAKLIESSMLKQNTLYPLLSIGSRHMVYTTNPCTPFTIHQTSSNRHINTWFLSRRSFAEDAAAGGLTESDILERITKVLGEMERAKVDASKPLTTSSSIADDVGLDSLDFVEFGIALEDEFGIEIDDDKAETIKTVGDAIKLIQEQSQQSEN